MAELGENRSHVAFHRLGKKPGLADLGGDLAAPQQAAIIDQTVIIARPPGIGSRHSGSNRILNQGCGHRDIGRNRPYGAAAVWMDAAIKSRDAMNDMLAADLSLGRADGEPCSGLFHRNGRCVLMDSRTTASR